MISLTPVQGWGQANPTAAFAVQGLPPRGLTIYGGPIAQGPSLQFAPAPSRFPATKIQQAPTSNVQFQPRSLWSPQSTPSNPSPLSSAGFVSPLRPRALPLIPQAAKADMVTGADSMAQRMFRYVTPLQAVGLFAAGAASALPLNWFLKGLTKPSQLLNAAQTQTILKTPTMSKVKLEHQQGIFLEHPLLASVMTALRDPHLMPRLKAYLGASVLGYVAGSLAEGAKEVLVRREETQIKADVLQRMTKTVQNSIEYKSQWDRWFKRTAQAQILETLKAHQVPHPEGLLPPGQGVESAPELEHYPFEPTHFSKPAFAAQNQSQSKFKGQLPPLSPSLEADQPTFKDAGVVTGLKALIYVAGMTAGVMGQTLLNAMKSPSSSVISAMSGQQPKRVLMEVTNIRNWEAMFLMGNRQLLMGVLGVAAAAKVGKTVMEAYKEIEVTRKHAQTEQRYQTYNWLHLDPAYHRVAETVAFNQSLLTLNEQLPALKHHRPVLKQQIETMLANIGRQSAPKYFPMTPAINLVPARS